MYKFAVFAIFAALACGIQAQSNIMDYMVMQSILGNKNQASSAPGRGNPAAADPNPFDALFGGTSSGNTGGSDPLSSLFGGNSMSSVGGGSPLAAIGGSRRGAGNAGNNDMFSSLMSSPMGLMAASSGAVENMFEMYACGQMNMPLNACLSASLLL
ncbi:uncharacterized protein LOC128203088 [Mya arenaria]|uniref:uncharacterized protein LOC128203088 n=1 Tax=Mya arenaria TaxID=6604 RepID=UPI0022E6663E|nr:uncharacterized protein LOC128203088 [Mya arenaria]